MQNDGLLETVSVLVFKLGLCLFLLGSNSVHCPEK